MCIRRVAAASTVALALVADAGFSSLLTAQEPSDIHGRVLSRDSIPLQGARVRAVTPDSQTVINATTDQVGQFRISARDASASSYLVTAALLGYRPQQQTVVRQADGTFPAIAFYLAPSVQALNAVQVAVRRPRPPRGGAGGDAGIGTAGIPEDLTHIFRDDPTADLLSALAAVPGVSLQTDANGVPRTSVLGTLSDDNAMTLNGITVSGLTLPSEGLSGRASTVSYDAGRRGTGGASIAFTAPGGSDYRMRTVRESVQPPQLQWNDPSVRLGGNRSLHNQFGGSVSGPFVEDKTFYSVPFQLDQTSRPLTSLSTFTTGALAALGLNADSVARLAALGNSFGIPTRSGAPGYQRSTNGQLLPRFDWSKDSNTTLNATGIISWQDGRGGGITPTSLAASGVQSAGWQVLVLPQLSTYVGGSVLEELTVGLQASRQHSHPNLAFPASRVLMTSSTSGDQIGSSLVTVGGGVAPGTDARQSSAQVKNETSWFTVDGRHLLRVTVDGQLRRSRSVVGASPGVFEFNSLDDFANARPATFTRTLASATRSASDASLLLGVGDTYLPRRGVQIQLGLQFQGTAIPSRPQYNPVVDSLFGRRTDRIPGAFGVSPMLGFNWTPHTARSGAVAPRNLFGGTLFGGVRRIAQPIDAASVESVIRTTGLQNAAQQLRCVGDATPIPDWSAYLDAVGNIPTTCADGTIGSPLVESTPPVSLFAPRYQSPESWRGSIGWRAFLARSLLGVVQYDDALNLHQRGSTDLNFDPSSRFRLPDESERPVYVSPASISTTAGAVSATESRRFDAFQRVSEINSGVRSRVRRVQFMLAAQLPPRGGVTGQLRLSYANQHDRERANGFSGGATAGDPRAAEWAWASGDVRHQITLQGQLDVRGWFTVSAYAAFFSGRPFTPRVSTDINGDGYANDRAFVFSPTTAPDSTVATGMAQLLASGGVAARCLRPQLTRVAARNSCRGPWTSLLRVSIIPGTSGLHLGQRTTVSFTLDNALAAVDRLVHGAHGLRGWGQPVGFAPDQTLLYVRGFDPATSRYIYDVNPRFGSTAQSRATVRAPFSIGLNVHIDLSPNRELQRLRLSLRPPPGDQSLTESRIKDRVATRLTTELDAILRLRDSLKLSPQQVDSLEALDRRVLAARDSIYADLARYLASLNGKYGGEALQRSKQAALDAEAAVAQSLPGVMSLLRSDQYEKLPQYLRSRIEESVHKAPDRGSSSSTPPNGAHPRSVTTLRTVG